MTLRFSITSQSTAFRADLFVAAHCFRWGGILSGIIFTITVCRIYSEVCHYGRWCTHGLNWCNIDCFREINNKAIFDTLDQIDFKGFR